MSLRDMVALVEAWWLAHWRAGYWIAGALEGLGVLLLVVVAVPVWWPAGLIGAGLLLQWRAGVAREEARAAAWFAAHDRKEPPLDG